MEYALNFDAGLENTQDINIVKHKTKEEANEVKTPQKVRIFLTKLYDGWNPWKQHKLKHRCNSNDLTQDSNIGNAICPAVM